MEVWIIDTAVSGSAADRYAAMLDPVEARRAARLYRAADRNRFIAVHGAVREILAGRLGLEPRALVWRRGADGKPALDEASLPLARRPAPEINYSESGGLAALAVSSRRAVGIDIQRTLPARTVTRMAARYFGPDEARFVAQAPAGLAADRFARLWTRKEAWAKAHGTRLGHVVGLPVGAEDEVVEDPAGRVQGASRLCDLAAPAGFRAAVALVGAAPFEVRLAMWHGAPGARA